MPKKYKNFFPSYKINRIPNINRMKKDNLVLWNIISRVIQNSEEPMNYLELMKILKKHEFSKEVSKSFLVHCFNVGWLYEVE